MMEGEQTGSEETWIEFLENLARSLLLDGYREAAYFVGVAAIAIDDKAATYSGRVNRQWDPQHWLDLAAELADRAKGMRDPNVAIKMYALVEEFAAIAEFVGDLPDHNKTVLPLA
jgi:hypothetical protein